MKKLNKQTLIAKTYAYLSYLFREPKLKIDQIFLFGSVARGDYDNNSDIDIFINTKFETETKKYVEHALKRFQEIEGKKWDLKEIKNPLSIKVGSLKDWVLQKSIEREGITLYSTTISSELQKHLLFTIESIKPFKKRIKIIRYLFGRKEKGYSSFGLINKYQGTIYTPRSFSIRSDGLKELTQFLTQEKIKFSFKEIWA